MFSKIFGSLQCSGCETIYDAVPLGDGKHPGKHVNISDYKGFLCQECEQSLVRQPTVTQLRFHAAFHSFLFRKWVFLTTPFYWLSTKFFIKGHFSIFICVFYTSAIRLETDILSKVILRANKEERMGGRNVSNP